MGLLNLPYASPLPFERSTEDLDGNTVWSDLDPTPAVVALTTPARETGIGPRYTQTGTVYVPRGTDRKAGDRFTYQGHNYTLVGPARGDLDQPFTGDDFGWMAFTFQGGESRWT